MISDPRTSEKWKCDFEGELDGDHEGDLEGDQVEEEPPCEEDGGCKGHVEAAEEQVGDREVDYEDGGRVPHLEDDEVVVVVDDDDDSGEVEKHGDNCDDDEKEGGTVLVVESKGDSENKWLVITPLYCRPPAASAFTHYWLSWCFFDQSDQYIAHIALLQTFII